MTTLNSRQIADIGVLIAAVAAVAVLHPALEVFGYGEVSWVGVAYVCVPLAVLWVTGFRRYGLALSAVVATVITGVAVAAVGVLFVLALGLSLSGSETSEVFLVLIWVVPPLVIVVLGLTALRLIRPRTET